MNICYIKKLEYTKQRGSRIVLVDRLERVVKERLKGQIKTSGNSERHRPQYPTARMRHQIPLNVNFAEENDFYFPKPRILGFLVWLASKMHS